ncbi:MAG: PfkB family carbohydrate kinase, partial [Bacteroidales bacterium]|nr:PfkB family carbohydrate kinase [Bacteroidales bacterium]
MDKLIAGLGEVLWDCLPEGKKLGGAPANFAYHASMFGYQAYAVSALGNDALGDRTVEELDKKHLRHIMPRIDFPTGTVQVELDEEGVPTYDIKRDVAWDNIPFTAEMEDLAKRCSCVCFGSLAQRNSVSHDTIHRFLHSTPKDCLKIFDINLRQNFYTKEIIQESLNACDILKINDEELVTIGRLFGYPGLDMENKCYLILGKYNLRMLVLTCGTNGS